MPSSRRARGNTATATDYFQQALHFELQAIAELTEPIEPTFSILHRSAGTLALDCNQHRLAEKLAAAALAQEPPHEVAEELRDLLEQAQFQRHLSLRGTSLSDFEMQMSLSGQAVGFGFVDSSEMIDRVTSLSKLVVRTAERQTNKPFRERGRTSKVISDNYPSFLSLPRAASFAVTIRLGGPAVQLPLLDDIPTSEQILDEIMDLMDLISSPDKENKKKEMLKIRIPDAAYYRNFLGLAKSLAPDGKRVRQVGLTSTHSGSTRSVSITTLAEHMPSAEIESDSRDGKAVEISGMLRYADATRDDDNEIKIVDEQDGRTYIVKVPEGMMNDIVRPLWDSPVTITGVDMGRYIALHSIQKSDSEEAS